MRICILDIETAPGAKYYWDLHEEHSSIETIIYPPRVLCWAAKWYGKPGVEFVSEWEDGSDRLVERAHELFEEADAIVHYYGKRFDVPHLHREMLLKELFPPGPHKDIDLKQVASRQFKFSSNKLDHVAQELGVGKKIEHEGFRLWRKICDPDVDEFTRNGARNRMRKYNIGDVRLTEKVYERMRPWIKGHPNVALHDGVEGGCPNCGSNDLMRNGFRYTQVGKYQRYRCKSCGAPVSSGKRIEGVDIRSAG